MILYSFFIGKYVDREFNDVGKNLHMATAWLEEPEELL